MVSRRFRRLERKSGGDAARGPAEGDVAAPSFRRALERDGELVLDETRVQRTHFCRGCEAENHEGSACCHACGAALGGAGQEDHDARQHEQRAARDAARKAAETEPAGIQEASPAVAGPASGAPGVERALREILERAEERDAPGIGAILATGVIAAGIFALVSMPLRLIFAAAAGAPIPWGRWLELGLVLAITAGLYRRFARQLRAL